MVGKKKRVKAMGGGKMGKRVKAMGGKKVGMGKRVKARGGNKIKKLAKGTPSGGIGAAASSAAEKTSKDKGTERASKAKEYKGMTRGQLLALLIGTASR
jgi:hypothetical protein